MIRWAPALGLASLVTGCVTSDVESGPVGPVFAGTVVVPFSHGANGEREPLTEYYASILELLHDAVLDRDPDRVRMLCDQHHTEAAPGWARRQFEHYRGIAGVIDVEIFLETESQLSIRAAGAPCIGEVVPMLFEVPSGAPQPVRLDPTGRGRFHVQVEITDYDCLGGHVERSFSQLLDLPAPVRLDLQRVEIPFDVDALPPEGVVRSLRCRVGLLPGDVELDGQQLPVRRTLCAASTFELYPKGVEPIAGAPLRTLENALRSGRTQHLDHVFLAARMMPESDREAAAERLIRAVRLGDSVLARAAMAALRELTGESISVDDRNGWLRWWLRRSSGSDGATSGGSSR